MAELSVQLLRMQGGKGSGPHQFNIWSSHSVVVFWLLWCTDRYVKV